MSALRRFIHTVFYVSLASSGAWFSASVSAQPPSGISFSAIKTAQSAGSLEAMVVDGGSLFSVRNLSHSAILVSHPKGDILYDTGIGRDVEAQMEVFNIMDQQLFAINEHKPARDQLDASGYDIGKLKAIVVGHMHWDHVSGLEDFLEVPVWVQEKSLVEANAGQPPGFVKSQYDDPGIKWVDLKLNQAPYMGFAESFDVFGDGSLVLVDLTGHSVGQVGMFVNLDDGRRYFFIGDTTWLIEGVQSQKSRPRFVQWMTGVDNDYEKNLAVVKQVHALSKSKENIIVVPAHDERVLQSLPRYPQFSQ
jgi:N-acyl homoserine lactone hydrolase